MLSEPRAIAFLTKMIENLINQE